MRVSGFYRFVFGAGAVAATLAGCGRSQSLPIFFAPQITASQSTVDGSARREKVLTRFTRTEGYFPTAGLIADASGALYGTTFLGGTRGGPYGGGTVFKLTPAKKGYETSILWNFSGSSEDGENPVAALIEDKAGALYGTTAAGGAYTYGTVFKLTRSASGYTLALLWSFDGIDGADPSSGLTASHNGSLYGTTQTGGKYSYGTVFELTPSKNGYAEHVLWNFGGSSGDGIAPSANVILDKSGAIYGTTGAGGNSSSGTVFKLTPSKKDYVESILWNFSDSAHDGAGPAAGVIADGSGALYGTTVEGGTGPCEEFGRTGCGTAFKLTPTKKGYKYTLLWSFGNSSVDGTGPVANLLLDAKGALYGTTAGGGHYKGSQCAYASGENPGCGTVFKLTPSQKGYTERVLWSFGSYSTDGISPRAALIAGPTGNLYSTTFNGGGTSCARGCGTVFELLH